MRLNRNLIAGLVILLMFATLVSNIMISSSIKKYTGVTGQAPSTTGVVNITIGNVSEPSPEPSPSTGGGGGGGASPKIFILDFRIQDSYSVIASRLDTIITIFSSDRNFTFNVDSTNKTTSVLKLGKTIIQVNKDFITYIDFDKNKADDLSIAYDGNEMIFIALRKPAAVEEVEPIITSKRILEGQPVQKPALLEKKNYLLLFILLLILIIALLLYVYSRRLKKVEKRKPIKKIEIKTEEKSIPRFEGKLKVLERGYREGLISKESYNKSVQRIKEIMKKR